MSPDDVERVADLAAACREDPDSVADERIREFLRHEDPAVRTGAVEAVAAFDGSAPGRLGSWIPSLVDRLADGDREVAAAAMPALVRAGAVDPGALVDELERVVASPDPAVHQRVASVFASGPFSRPFPAGLARYRLYFVGQLTHENPRTRANALAALREVAAEYPDAVARVVDAVADATGTARTRGRALGVLATLSATRPAAVAPVVGPAVETVRRAVEGSREGAGSGSTGGTEGDARSGSTGGTATDARDDPVVATDEDVPDGMVAAIECVERVGRADPDAVAGATPALSAIVEAGPPGPYPSPVRRRAIAAATVLAGSVEAVAGAEWSPGMAADGDGEPVGPGEPGGAASVPAPSERDAVADPGGVDVGAILSNLAGEDPADRYVAAVAGYWVSEARPDRLVALLDDLVDQLGRGPARAGDRAIHPWIADALYNLATAYPATVLPELIDATSADDPGTRRYATGALSRGPGTAPLAPSHRVRVVPGTVAEAGRIRELLSDPDDGVRDRAFLALSGVAAVDPAAAGVGAGGEGSPGVGGPGDPADPVGPRDAGGPRDPVALAGDAVRDGATREGAARFLAEAARRDPDAVRPAVDGLVAALDADEVPTAALAALSRVARRWPGDVRPAADRIRELTGSDVVPVRARAADVLEVLD